MACVWRVGEQRWLESILVSSCEKFGLSEAAAEVPHLKGGAFHPYRRKWATERKHLPIQDVMAADGWLDRRSVEQCYQHADEETILKVVTEPQKLREA